MTEKTTVEDYIIQKLQENGWKYVPADELERDSYQEPLLIPNLIRAIKRINSNKKPGDDDIKKVINDLKLTGSGQEGAKRILNYYKAGVPVKFERDRVLNFVQLFDFSEIKNNELIVSRQIFHEGRERIINDIFLYINGIPLVNIECKNPTDATVTWYDAYKQIKDYEQKVPELYKYAQIGIAVEAVAKYFPIVPWQEEVKTSEWREELKDSVDSTIELLNPDTLLDVIKSFLFSRIESGNATKVISRYMQYRAANKVVDRVLNNRQGQTDFNKGLVWHWQGSGKTLTMIFAANKLHLSKELENPTIFFIVDRDDLEEQLNREFNSLDMVKPEVINSVKELKEILCHDAYRGKRGIFITLVHKFRPNELIDLKRELDEETLARTTISNRNNVIGFVDEGHRSQYGIYASQMRAILKSAFFFAFTGTPIQKKGRDTYKDFCPKGERYLDKYFITDSILDEFTVRIVYQLRLEGKGINLDKEKLETFLGSDFEELPEAIKEEVKEEVKIRLNRIKLFLENPERIRVVADDIARHFQENIDGRFKAMVVAPSRKACVLYKNELDKHLPPNYSEIVMTYASDDEATIHDYFRESRYRYAEKEIEELRKEITENYLNKEYPKILIVTDMLLTGFDAPILQTMYLDKPLKEHRLLQAVARTNRPYKDLKEAGLVIDYVGVLRELNKALEIYSTDDIREAMVDYESLKLDFAELIDETLKIFQELPRNYERETLLGAIEILTGDKDREKSFTEKYRIMRRIYELLGPDQIKIEYFESYKWVSAIYVYHLKLVLQQKGLEEYIKKYCEKTIKSVHQSTEIQKIDESLPVIELDENYLRKIEEKVKTKKEKAANILFILNRFVLVNRHRNPVNESLVEWVERLLRLWREKIKDYETIYGEGVKILEKLFSLRERQKSLGFTDLQYSVLLTLEEKLKNGKDLIGEVKELAERIKSASFPGWINQPSARKEVERETRRFTRGLIKKYGISASDMDGIYGKLIESIKNYGT